MDEHVDQASFRLVGCIEASVISDCRLAASSVLLSFLLLLFSPYSSKMLHPKRGHFLSTI